jgi:copper chaperone CopZ
MKCGMCEAHMNEAIKAAFKVKKVVSSHEKNVTVVLSESELDVAELKKTVSEAGYELISVSSAPYKKKLFGIFG